MREKHKWQASEARSGSYPKALEEYPVGGKDVTQKEAWLFGD